MNNLFGREKMLQPDCSSNIPSSTGQIHFTDRGNEFKISIEMST